MKCSLALYRVENFGADTKFYWSLTRNIFRFEYLSTDAGDGAHTVDESKPLLFSCVSMHGLISFYPFAIEIRADNWLDSIRFYTLLILNADESEDL